MTTIAWDGKTLAADTLMLDGTFRDLTQTYKIEKTDDGDWFATCGSAYVAQKFKDGSITQKDYKSGQVLIVREDGSASVSDYTGYFFPVTPPFAMGSGGALALGAMLAGATPEKAVLIAMEIDTQTGGSVQSVLVKEPH